MKKSSQAASPGERILKLAGEQLFVRPRDVERMGIAREYLLRLCAKGKLVRTGWGMYQRPGAAVGEHRVFAEVATRVPRATICLASALAFHKLTNRNPKRVSIALPPRTRQPRLDTVSLRFHRFSGPALTAGRETHLVEGVPVRVYNPAKTVADCFKFRNRIGLGVARKALRTCLSRQQATVRQIKHYARICRVLRVMRPYLDAP